MSMQDLQALYRATEEDMLFGVGLLAVPGQAPAPLIQIHYPNWSRQMLEVVRDAFSAGIVLTITPSTDDTSDLRLATHARITLGTDEVDQSSILRAPAWDARLGDVEGTVIHSFEENRRRYGGFLLLMQSVNWEFLTVVDESAHRTATDAVRTRRMPIPGSA